jgi:hypothetical protein
MWTVSKWAMEQVLQDIRNGVEYPDRWTETEEQAEMTKEKLYKRWWEEDEDEQE